MVDTGGRLELFEAKWTELPRDPEAVNLAFGRNVVGSSHVTGGSVVCRTPDAFLLDGIFRALPVTELGLLSPEARLASFSGPDGYPRRLPP